MYSHRSRWFFSISIRFRPNPKVRPQSRILIIFRFSDEREWTDVSSAVSKTTLRGSITITSTIFICDTFVKAVGLAWLDSAWSNVNFDTTHAFSEEWKNMLSHIGFDRVEQSIRFKLTELEPRDFGYRACLTASLPQSTSLTALLPPPGHPR